MKGREQLPNCTPAEEEEEEDRVEEDRVGRSQTVSPSSLREQAQRRWLIVAADERPKSQQRRSIGASSLRQ